MNYRTESFFWWCLANHLSIQQGLWSNWKWEPRNYQERLKFQIWTTDRSASKWFAAWLTPNICNAPIRAFMIFCVVDASIPLTSQQFGEKLRHSKPLVFVRQLLILALGKKPIFRLKPPIFRRGLDLFWAQNRVWPPPCPNPGENKWLLKYPSGENK